MESLQTGAYSQGLGGGAHQDQNAEKNEEILKAPCHLGRFKKLRKIGKVNTNCPKFHTVMQSMH